MAGGEEACEHAIFQKWDMYSIVVRENYMRHAEITTCMSQTLKELEGPLRVVDIGCGDAWLASTVLKMFEVDRYLGIDLSADALNGARTRVPLGRNESGEFEFVCSDLRTAIPAVTTGSANVVLASYSLHHVSQDEKRCLLGEISRILQPGGLFIWTDVVRQPGHNREQTLSLIEQDMRQHWTALTTSEIDQAVAHIQEADFPEEADWMTAAATAQSLTPSAPLYRDELYGCWSFMATSQH